MADEKAAVDLQRKRPLWRVTRAMNTAPATSLRPGVHSLHVGRDRGGGNLPPARLASAHQISANSAVSLRTHARSGLQAEKDGRHPRFLIETRLRAFKRKRQPLLRRSAHPNAGWATTPARLRRRGGLSFQRFHPLINGLATEAMLGADAEIGNLAFANHAVEGGRVDALVSAQLGHRHHRGDGLIMFSTGHHAANLTRI
jgi:hypothetical protein